ncbi:carboxymuconolactone decarboxylase family protein [Alisedimentitalea sp. MJ-SS2]|uniref:carboxymuconolactone decarboxylase family protein n=1 Tax=Aliisedimentitalea sp. MJ-SS2 TaxID=3049795 RepID=UPI0029127E37|nr:carboxymuconolactone decarboxylase family protein [Alisedimentitalea sp. MJ-SS2]MDU8928236.1 carboxymuconolactone decarboxylase family protein [Alisedimentitalea sp. MJ-SS2]
MSWKADIDTTRNQLRELNKTIPEATKGFAALTKGVKEAGVLDFKHKEYVALGIAVATHCEACIAFHIEALVRIGASRDEVADVLAMAIQMGGGPALMYAGKALECFDELSAG